MKAWTVPQPFASLIVMGALPHWCDRDQTPPGLIEERVVVYAHPRPMDAGDIIRLHENAAFENSVPTGIRADLALALLERLRVDEEKGARASRVPLGMALGTVRLGRAKLLTSLYPDDPEVRPDVWAWALLDAQAFERPIAAVPPPADFWEWAK